MPVRLVGLDLVGTLIYPDPPVAAVYRAAGERHGVPLAEPEVKRRFAEAFRRSSFGRGSDVEHKGLWRAIVEAVFRLEPDSCGPLFDELWKHFSLPSAWRAFDDARPSIAKLLANGFEVAVASNFDRRIEPILRGHQLWDDIHVFWSSELRASKPDERFFRAIEVAVGVDAAHCLMVGDSLDNDYRGAVAAGWSALLVDRSPGKRHGPATTIHSLQELHSELARASSE